MTVDKFDFAKSKYVVIVQNRKWGNEVQVFETLEQAKEFKEQAECDFNNYCRLYERNEEE